MIRSQATPRHHLAHFLAIATVGCGGLRLLACVSRSGSTMLDRRKMRAIEYSRTGDPDVLSLVDLPVPEPSWRSTA